MKREKKCQIICHRGCNYDNFNPNTIRAFKKVLEEGASAFEFDVQLTADSELIVIHNLDLSEVSTGVGPVQTTTWDEISGIYSGDPEQGKDRIPKLEEVLQLVASLPVGRKITMNLELKGMGSGSPSGQLIRRWLDSGRLAIDNFLISSFDWGELRQFKKHCPELDLALICGAILRDKLLPKLPCGPENFHKVFAYPAEAFILPKKITFAENKHLIDAAYTNQAERDVFYDVLHRALEGDFYNETLLSTAEELNAVAVNLWDRSLSVDFMKQAQARGFKVNIFTVNEVSEMKKWSDAGVDGIFTDFYSDAVAALH